MIGDSKQMGRLNSLKLGQNVGRGYELPVLSSNKEQSKNVVTLLMPSFSSENARALGGPETNIYLLEANKSALLSYASS